MSPVAWEVASLRPSSGRWRRMVVRVAKYRGLGSPNGVFFWPRGGEQVASCGSQVLIP